MGACAPKAYLPLVGGAASPAVRRRCSQQRTPDATHAASAAVPRCMQRSEAAKQSIHANGGFLVLTGERTSRSNGCSAGTRALSSVPSQACATALR